MWHEETHQKRHETGRRKKKRREEKENRMKRDREDLWSCNRVSYDWAMHNLVIITMKLAKALRSKVQIYLIFLTERLIFKTKPNQTKPKEPIQKSLMPRIKNWDVKRILIKSFWLKFENSSILVIIHPSSPFFSEWRIILILLQSKNCHILFHTQKRPSTLIK